MSLTIPPGDCYLLDHGGSDRHFFFVISAPEKFPERRLVLVPLTSLSKEKKIDYSCLVSAGEHAHCTVDSYAFYRGALIVPRATMEKMLCDQKASHRPPPADAALLKRLRDGAEITEFLIGDAHQELYEQGILPPL